MVQPGEFAREVEAQSVPGDVLARGAAVETLKNMQLGLTGNGRTGVADREDRPPALAARREADPAAGTIVFSRVFQQILQDQGEVTFFPGHEKRGRDFRLDREVGVIRQGAEIIDPGINQRLEVDGTEIDLQASGIHPGKQQKVFDHAGEPEGLVDERGEVRAHLGGDGLAGEQFLEAGAQDGHRRLKLVGGVGGKPGGALEFFAGQPEGGFGSRPLSAVLLRIHRELHDRNRQAGGEEIAGGESAEHEQDAGAGELPAQPPLIDAWIDDLGALPDYPDLAVETEVPPALLVAGEERYLTLILQNLLENARKYNRPGGRIRLAARSEGGWAVLTVGNTGPPIPRQAQLHIFERFHRGTAGEDIPGHGLGLNLARELARLHHGELRLTRSDEGWTEFEVRFRLAGGASATVSAIA